MVENRVASKRTVRRSGFWRSLERAVTTFLAIIVVVLLIVAVALAVLVHTGPDGESIILGHPVFSVASGSMTPTFDTGDLIFDQQASAASAKNLHKGQIITFRADSPTTENLPTVITHRIYAVNVALNTLGVPAVSYTTKGDANDAPDNTTVASTAILGLYQGRIPFGGYVLSSLHQPITFILLILIPVIYLVFMETRRRWIAIGATGRPAASDERPNQDKPW